MILEKDNDSDILQGQRGELDMQDTQLYAMLLGLKAPWHVTKVQVDMAKERIDVWVEEEQATVFLCAQCKKAAPVYDHTLEQVWRHLDTCQCRTYLHACLPRTNCTQDGVKQILAPWAEPRSRFTLLFEGRLIDTLRECDVTGVTRLCATSWDETWSVMAHAVERGLARKERRVPQRLGIDEKSLGKGHHYESLVSDLDYGTVEHVVDDRTQESLASYYRQFTREELAAIKAIAMDMWDPYVAATKAYVPGAEDKIVYDRFHVTTQVTKALDKVRRQENKTLVKDGDERLVGTKFLWLRNEDNVPDSRRAAFEDVKDADLKTSRAWAIKESLRGFWNYIYPASAAKYFKRWYFWATHSRLGPIIGAAKTLKNHLANIMTYFKHRITNATAEGLNSKIQTIKLMACGYRNRDHYKTAIYFHCGGLDLYPRQAAA
jgi:transposase